VAPLAGAGLFAAFGGGVVAVLDAITFAGSALLMSQMRAAETKPEPAEHYFLREVTAGIAHIWRSLPLRQMTAAAAVSLLVVGFAETLIFFVIAHLGKSPSFFGVFGAILGLGIFGVGDLLLIVPSLPIVLLGFTIAGVGIMWAIVGFTTALQLRTPLAIQGRVSAAADISLNVAQTVSIATGAALSTIVDYRILFVAMAVVVVSSATYLVTRQHDSSVRATEQLLT
jgi:hypothetical protein